MNRSLKYVLLVFGLLVALNYFLLATESFFSNFHLFPAGTASAQNSDYYDGLPEVNFSLFKKGGVGWSEITQGYGRTPYSSIYPNDWHDGIDIGAQYGAAVYVPEGGTVLATGDEDNYCYHRAFGKYIAVTTNDDNYVLFFAHLGDIDVHPGESIASGALIGTIGNTGLETGPHLHFSVFDPNGFTMTPRLGCGPEPTGKDEDPIPYLEEKF